MSAPRVHVSENVAVAIALERVPRQRSKTLVLASRAGGSPSAIVRSVPSRHLTLARSCQAGVGLLGGRAALFSGSGRRRAARTPSAFSGKRRAALLFAVFGRLAAQAKNVRPTQQNFTRNR